MSRFSFKLCRTGVDLGSLVLSWPLTRAYFNEKRDVCRFSLFCAKNEMRLVFSFKLCRTGLDLGPLISSWPLTRADLDGKRDASRFFFDL